MKQKPKPKRKRRRGRPTSLFPEGDDPIRHVRAKFSRRVKLKPREFWLCNGRDRTNWVVVNSGHSVEFCGGEKIKVMEVLE